ncbi:MAG: cytochrome c1 [Gammaproteobacteria bacterium]|nr:cytochrome c1 [Gammaproteobacteria bacterium]
MKARGLAASLLLALALLPGLAGAAGPELVLAQAPDRSHDQQALQRGARTFIGYCLGCHPASLMRFNRLADLGFTDEQISKEFLLGARRIGDPMTSTMRRDDAKKWFGIAPPDLSVIARARTSRLGPGADWLYTYLRGFYRDPTRPSGWNNVVFQNVAMHHVLWEFQGRLSPQEYDGMVADLVGYLVYMSEPTAQSRRHIGWYVLGGALVLLLFAFAVKPPPRKSRRREHV